MQHGVIFTPATRLQLEGFVIRLRKLCDSTLLRYILKLADTPAKRNHLYIAYIALGDSDHAYELDNNDYGLDYGFHDAVKDLPHFLDLHSPDFPLAWEDLRKFLVIKQGWFLPSYLENLLSDSGRSGIFHCNPNRWAAFVAARYLRYLRTTR